MATSSETDERPHVQARFFTKQPSFSIPDTLYSLPSSVSSKELNNIVHSVLYDDDASSTERVEFDFLVDGDFLRSSLEVHLEDQIISSDTVLEIEYLERQAAPRPEISIEHDDWVSCVRGRDDIIVCGCYDNTIKLWTRSGQCLTTIPGHTGPVKCVAWLNSPTGDEDYMFASGSFDQTLLVWRWKKAEKEVECIYACKGHSASVDCVAVNDDGARIVTGSWDNTVKLWTAVTEAEMEEAFTDPADGDESKQRKKQKSNSNQRMKTRVPIVTLSGHKEAVSSAVWLDESNICTASWDHTLRTWDMSRPEVTNIVEGSKAFFSIAYSPLSNLIVSASADRHVRLHDLRTKEMKGTYTSHTGWVSSVDWSKTDEHLFISGSHDTMMKLWDTRSTKAPLYNLIGQEDKILAVDWSIPDLMLSGGADNQLKIFNYRK